MTGGWAVRIEIEAFDTGHLVQFARSNWCKRG